MLVQRSFYPQHDPLLATVSQGEPDGHSLAPVCDTPIMNFLSQRLSRQSMTHAAAVPLQNVLLSALPTKALALLSAHSLIHNEADPSRHCTHSRDVNQD